MRKTIISRTVIAFALLLVSNIPAIAADIYDKAEVQNFIDGIMASNMDENNNASAVVKVMKDGDVIFSKGYGYIDQENKKPVRVDTSLFRPGSISKLFTWVSVMQLEEQGKIDLDRDVNEYITSFKIEDTYPGEPITMRHLITHTPGFEDGFLGYLFIDSPERFLPLEKSLENTQPKRINPPGKISSYSNWSIALAGLIVQNISGLSFNDYVKQNIFDPLGMSHSSFDEPLPQSLLDNMATAYDYGAGKYISHHYEYISNFGPAGSLAASADDISKFAQMLINGGELNGVRILSSDSLSRMINGGFTFDERLRGIGLGFFKWRWGPDEMNLFGHGGNTDYFASHLAMSQSDDFMIFLSVSGKGGRTTANLLIEAFYDRYFPRDTSPVMPPIDFEKRAEQYTGTFQSWRSNFSTIEAFNRFSRNIAITAMDDNTLLINNKRYVEIDQHLFREVDDFDTVAFIENENGEIDTLVYDGVPFGPYRKVGFMETQDYATLINSVIGFIYLLVILRLIYRWKNYRAAIGSEKSVWNASLIVVASGILTSAFIQLAFNAINAAPFAVTPIYMPIALSFAMLTVPLTGYYLYRFVKFWPDAAQFDRIRYSALALVLLWGLHYFYSYNMLGYNYH